VLPVSGDVTFAIDDLVQPFQIEGLGIRGRIVRLGPLVDRVLKAHAYPEPVSRLLGEALALTVMIGSALKFDGRFILQTQSKGPVGMLVADFQSPGSIRGYAQMDEARVAEALSAWLDGQPGWRSLGHVASPIEGGDGNREFLLAGVKDR
jgi:molecular chaperone Hsp33